MSFGLGLRSQHYPYILANKPKVDWFEIISENFMDTEGRPKTNLAQIKELYPIVMHGVSLSIGTVDPLNSEYLSKLKKLIRWVNPLWISDHLCWTGVAHKNTHDLLPVPYTEEALKHIVQRLKEVQDFLEMKIALENPSTYLEFKNSQMSEAEFIARMVEKSGCELLLDVNNVYVTCYNHGLDPQTYIDSLPLNKVKQIHLSGHSNKGTHIIDTHDDHVIDEVWNLYKYVVNKAGRTPNTMIEWDDNIPEFPELFAELEKAKSAAKNAENYILPKISLNDSATKSVKKLSLLESQNLLQQAIMAGGNFDSKPAKWIRQKEKFSAANQLAVYVNSYRYRLYDITAEDYPVLEKYLGTKKFQQLIWDFVNSEQPNHFNIARYTLKLPNFIKKKFPNDIFAHELCDLETTIAQLGDVEESAVLTTKDLENLTAESLMESVLKPRKALKLQRFSFLTNQYYQAIMDDKKARAIKKISYLVIFRHADKVWRMDLEKDEFALLKKIFSGVKVGAALKQITNPKTSNISHWFARWINNGLLAKVTVPRQQVVEQLPVIPARRDATRVAKKSLTASEGKINLNKKGEKCFQLLIF